MSDVNDVLKKVSAALEEATGKFNAKAEEALTEAKKSGQLSASTKEVVDKMALEFNALTAAEKTLKVALGELEQHVAQMPLSNAVQTVESIGQQVVSAEALKGFVSTLAASQRISIPVKAALLSVDVPGQIVAPHRLRVSMLRLNSDCLSVICLHLVALNQAPFIGFSRPDSPIMRESLLKTRKSLIAIFSSEKNHARSYHCPPV